MGRLSTSRAPPDRLASREERRPRKTPSACLGAAPSRPRSTCVVLRASHPPRPPRPPPPHGPPAPRAARARVVQAPGPPRRARDEPALAGGRGDVGPETVTPEAVPARAQVVDAGRGPRDDAPLARAAPRRREHGGDVAQAGVLPRGRAEGVAGVVGRVGLHDRQALDGRQGRVAVRV